MFDALADQCAIFTKGEGCLRASFSLEGVDTLIGAIVVGI